MITPLILTKLEGVIAFPWDEIIVGCIEHNDCIIVTFDFVYEEKTYYMYFYRTDITPSTVLDWLACPTVYSVVCKITDISPKTLSSYSQVIRCKTFQEVRLFLERLAITDML